MGRRVTIDNLAEEVSKILDEYVDEIADGVDVATKKTAQLGARALNASSGKTFKGKKYRKSWTSKTTKTRLSSTGVIYSKMPGLPHLLEYGHANRDGGRTPGRAHISPVEQELISAFESEVRLTIDKA